MSSTKRTPPKGPDRPLIRSSHGGVSRGRPKGKGEAAVPEPREAAARPAARRGPKDAKAAAARRARATLPKPPGEEREAGGEAEAPSTKSAPKKAKLTAPVVSTASDEAREVAIAIATAAIDKKASGLEVIDVAGRVDYADFLVLMSGRSDRHVAALAGGIEDALRKMNKRALAVEGLPHANWVLMDFGDVVVHVFQDDARATYDFDALWMDARRVPVPLPVAPVGS